MGLQMTMKCGATSSYVGKGPAHNSGRGKVGIIDLGQHDENDEEEQFPLAPDCGGLTKTL